MRDWKWSPAEKAAARRAFDKALKDELETVMQQTRDRAARIRDASELWKLESWLGHRRREIDEKYDYRYSVLPMVFARLVNEGRLAEEDLKGLDAPKIEAIRFLAGSKA